MSVKCSRLCQDKLSRSDFLIFFRVTSTRPSFVISTICVGTGSFFSAAPKTFKSSLSADFASRLIKSTMTIPEILRSLNCLAIFFCSFDYFTLRKFSCYFPFWQLFFPVFTSITVRASVGWIIRYAPDFNHTLSLNAS